MAARLWTEAETLALARAWVQEDAVSRETARTPGDANEALYHSFLRLARLTPAHRACKGVLAKRYQLRRLFECIYEFNQSQEDMGGPLWFQLPLTERKLVRATWDPSRAKGELSLKAYNTLLPILAPTRASGSSARSGHIPVSRVSGGPVSSFEQWEYPELMILARASAETRRAYPRNEVGFDAASMAPLLAKYRDYGGSRRRTKQAVAKQAMSLMEAYRFISAFNKRARKAGEENWFRRSAEERRAGERQFNGAARALRHMDKKMFIVMKSSRSPSKRIKREATEIHQVTERRRYRVSNGQSVVSVNEKRRIRSGRVIDSTATATLATARADSSEPVGNVARMLRHHLHGQSRESVQEEGDGGDMALAEICPATQQSRAVVSAQADPDSYTSALEHAVTTLSTQLAEIDRRLTETRVSENNRMLVRVLRACRQSSGSVPSELVQEILKCAGSNTLQAMDLASQQQKQSDELMQRLMAALADGGAA